LFKREIGVYFNSLGDGELGEKETRLVGMFGTGFKYLERDNFSALRINKVIMSRR
jgi:hypothetical protein